MSSIVCYFPIFYFLPFVIYSLISLSRRTNCSRQLNQCTHRTNWKPVTAGLIYLFYWRRAPDDMPSHVPYGSCFPKVTSLFIHSHLLKRCAPPHELNRSLYVIHHYVMYWSPLASSKDSAVVTTAEDNVLILILSLVFAAATSSGRLYCQTAMTMRRCAASAAVAGAAASVVGHSNNVVDGSSLWPNERSNDIQWKRYR
jgi:hypothetical protein